MGLIWENTAHPSCAPRRGLPFVSHPLPNLWMGVSAEDQPRWDERVADLRQIDVAVRWISAEPLLGPIVDSGDMRAVDWVVVGGESGPRSRPMHPEWARSLRDACAATNVPFLFKQWGDWVHPAQIGGADHPALMRVQADAFYGGRADQVCVLEDAPFARVGKKAAGRLLDDVRHDGMPA